MRQKLRNRILSFGLVLAMALGMMPGMTVSAATSFGTGGATYTLSNGVLTISGGSFKKEEFVGLRTRALSSDYNSIKSVVFVNTKLSDTAHELFCSILQVKR